MTTNPKRGTGYRRNHREGCCNNEIFKGTHFITNPQDLIPNPLNIRFQLITNRFDFI